MELAISVASTAVCVAVFPSVSQCLSVSLCVCVCLCIHKCRKWWRRDRAACSTVASTVFLCVCFLVYLYVCFPLCICLSVYHEARNRGERQQNDRWRYTSLLFLLLFVRLCVRLCLYVCLSEWKRWGRKRRRNDDDDDMMMMMMMMFALKGTNQDLLQPPCCSVNCLRQVRSKGQGAIVCKSRATHWVLIGYEGAAQLLCLTELKSYLFLAFFIG